MLLHIVQLLLECTRWHCRIIAKRERVWWNLNKLPFLFTVLSSALWRLTGGLWKGSRIILTERFYVDKGWVHLEMGSRGEALQENFYVILEKNYFNKKWQRVRWVYLCYNFILYGIYKTIWPNTFPRDNYTTFCSNLRNTTVWGNIHEYFAGYLHNSSHNFAKSIEE